MRIKELQRVAHAMSVNKGFWDGDLGNDTNIPTKISLIHAELSEALEEYRDDHMNKYYADDGKPEGFGVELADAVIRLCDLAEGFGYDLEALIAEKMEYNKTRPLKHGKRV